MISRSGRPLGLLVFVLFVASAPWLLGSGLRQVENTPRLVGSLTAGNVVVADGARAVEDGGVALSDLPTSSDATDNALIRANGTTGNVEGTSWILEDDGDLQLPSDATVPVIYSADAAGWGLAATGGAAANLGISSTTGDVNVSAGDAIAVSSNNDLTLSSGAADVLISANSDVTLTVGGDFTINGALLDLERGTGSSITVPSTSLVDLATVTVEASAAYSFDGIMRVNSPAADDWNVALVVGTATCDGSVWAIIGGGPVIYAVGSTSASISTTGADQTVSVRGTVYCTVGGTMKLQGRKNTDTGADATVAVASLAFTQF